MSHVLLKQTSGLYLLVKVRIYFSLNLEKCVRGLFRCEVKIGLTKILQRSISKFCIKTNCLDKDQQQNNKYGTQLVNTQYYSFG